ncbi:hypothetical protein Q8F55_008486 [Vanrija albida]|uniref:Major facilitator superfamily (MFS) profile domain-containing protein n=1 Tax=Vanrija albida TaxID=181172 RepID=A0ABR3PQZ4_9TREE
MKTQFNIFRRGRPLRAAVTFACQMAFVLFGYDQGVFSGIIGNEDYLRTFNHPNAGLTGIIVSIFNLGCFFGCILTFFICELLGRRKCMWFAMVFIVVGATMQTVASNVPLMMVGRFITGIGTGIEASTVPPYLSEICPPHKRGRLVSSAPLFIGIGIVIAFWFDYGMAHVPGGLSWRLPIGFQMVWAVIVVFLVFGLPESPRYLYVHGRNDEALQVLCDINDARPDDPAIVKEQGEILDAIALEREHGEYQWSQLFKRDDVQTSRRLVLAYFSMFFQQLTWVNNCVVYLTTVLETSVGLDRNLSLILGGAVNIVFTVGCLIPTLFLDQMGRRKPMLVGSAGCGVSMLLIAVLLSFGKKVTSTASIAFFFTFMFSHGATWNGVAFAYIPEILPLHIRAKGTALCISGNFLWNFFVVMVSPTILEALTWKAFILFGLTSICFIPIIYVYYPETTRLSLEEIDWLFLKPDVVKTSIQVAKHGWGALLEGPHPRSVGSEEEKGGGVVHTEEVDLKKGSV